MSRGRVPFSVRRDGGTYLSLDQSLGHLDLGLAERPSVLRAHVRPYREVGGLIQGLRRGGDDTRWSSHAMQTHENKQQTVPEWTL